MAAALSRSQSQQNFDNTKEADAIDEEIYEKSKELRALRKAGTLTEDEEVDRMEEIDGETPCKYLLDAPLFRCNQFCSACFTPSI